MATFINGREVVEANTEKLIEIAEVAQKQSRKRWVISICVSVVALLVAIIIAT